MARRLIGTGTTDSTGKISVSYTGTGAGKLQLVAVQGNLTSETYELHDCIVFDKAVTESKYDGWIYNTTDVSESTGDNGTTVTNSSESTGRSYMCNRPDTTTPSGLDYQGRICIECDIISGSGTVSSQFGYSGNYAIRNLTQLGLTGGGHLKIEYTGTKANYYINGSSTPTVSLDANMGSEMYEIRFYLPASTSFTFKNFEIYPIQNQVNLKIGE